MKIINLNIKDEKYINQAANHLLECFEHAWKTKEEALEEVNKSLEDECICRAAIDEDDNLIGWISGFKRYGGNVWELHPVVVRKDCQGKGVGSKLVEDFEIRVAERGGITVLLGSDDENGSTSISGIDIYPDFYENMKNIKNIKRHPFEFYQKLGYKIVGVIPDANGFGKPDILMAKRVKV